MSDEFDPDEDLTPIDDSDWDAGETEHEGEEDFDEAGETTGTAKSVGEVIRISEDIARKIPVWTGVSSCCSSSRALKEFKPHFEKWVAQTIAKHPDKVPVAKGNGRGKTKCKKKKLTNGKRRCKGWFTTVVAYVDFE